MGGSADPSGIPTLGVCCGITGAEDVHRFEITVSGPATAWEAMIGIAVAEYTAFDWSRLSLRQNIQITRSLNNESQRSETILVGFVGAPFITLSTLGGGGLIWRAFKVDDYFNVFVCGLHRTFLPPPNDGVIATETYEKRFLPTILEPDFGVINNTFWAVSGIQNHPLPECLPNAP